MSPLQPLRRRSVCTLWGSDYGEHTNSTTVHTSVPTTCSMRSRFRPLRPSLEKHLIRADVTTRFRWLARLQEPMMAIPSKDSHRVGLLARRATAHVADVTGQ